MKTLVLGIGNELLTDEGIGIHAIRHLERAFDGRPDIEFLDGGTLSFSLAGAVAGADRLLVIDAARMEAPPGTVRLFRDEAMDTFLADCKCTSVHEVGLLDLIGIARLTDTLPAERALIGIQPDKVDWGEEPTPAVAASLAAVAAIARQLLGEGRTPDSDAGGEAHGQR